CVYASPPWAWSRWVPRPRDGSGRRQGSEEGCARLRVELRYRRRLHGARALARGVTRVRRSGGGRRAPGTGNPAAGVRSDDPDRVGLLLHEPRRPDRGTTFSWATRALGRDRHRAVGADAG